jgi:hypothetical protein
MFRNGKAKILAWHLILSNFANKQYHLL